MSMRNALIAAAWFALAGLLLALALVLIFGVGGALRAKNGACQDALTTADARYALSESTVALTYDAWQADLLGDVMAAEYATEGIAQNHQDISAINTTYDTLRKECTND